ncbi:CAZyme family AA1 [Penicillium angulare]|uniref:CAZyme family AA1 n=1 Tax=Penicillium angulare TaxID=116970 RepID=A0A9W9FI64_9EURO|nr:CAZyme family AA1 [Penicillium angulare]
MRLSFIFVWVQVLLTTKAHLPNLIDDAISPTPKYCPTKPCIGNTPCERTKWCNYNISTDYEAITPTTGVTRESWFYVNDLYLQPDGYHNRSVITINDTIPGPTIFANWGDEVVVHVKNNISSRIENGSTIHFHGVRQYFTNHYDGVPSLTQCPIAPQSLMTYRWRATQYGTSWYHSHIGLQTWEGVFGGVIINGPATANYDHDMGMLFLNDWTYQTPDELYSSERSGDIFTIDSGLMNGTNVYDNNGQVTGRRFIAKVTEGESYRFRIVNAAINSHYEFKIDHHNLTVIAMDLVPIVPYVTESVVLGMGQRYDVIVHANQSSLAKSFWIQAIPKICGGNPNNPMQGVLDYGKIPTLPTLPLQDSNRPNCSDEPLALLKPYVKKDVKPFPRGSWNKSITSSLYSPVVPIGFYSWYLNRTSMQVDWANPTLKQIYENRRLRTTFQPYSNESSFVNGTSLISIPNKGQWIYVNILSDPNEDPESHPIHLHGHDFYILAQGDGEFNGVVNTKNPARRDTALLPSKGYLVIAIKANNPGIWLMHCHIGFSIQFLERQRELRNLIDFNMLNQTCEEWNAYTAATGLMEINDSGV